MKAKALQELVNSIFNDEKIKQQFMSNPNEVLSRFSLTEPEKKAILSTHMKLGLVTSGSEQLEEIVGPTGTWL
jgi:hypothetical protein